MIEIIGIVLWTAGIVLISSAIAIAHGACKEKNKEGESDNLTMKVLAFSALGFGIVLLSMAGYEFGRGDPTSFSDNTLYLIETDSINNTIYRGC